MVAFTFNLSAWEAQAGGSLDLKPAWSMKRHTVSKQNKTNKPKITNKQPQIKY